MVRLRLSPILRVNPSLYMQKTNQRAVADPGAGVPSALLAFLAAGAGLGVAPLYYSQPMLGTLGVDIGASAAAVGMLPTLAQLGYALGILLLIPLGDRYDRRRIILLKAALLCLALGLAAVAPGLSGLLLASLIMGTMATLAQDIVPAAATLSTPGQRGKVVGTVMTGLLLGILLSRVVSGLVAEYLGWRWMFALAALSILIFAALAWRMLPRFEPTTRLPYAALLGSLVQLWRQHPALRRAAWAQGLISIGFSAFWSTLAVMLHNEPFHLGAAAAGAFGLAGAVGALAAPLAGRMADRHGPERVTRLGASVVVGAFAALALAHVLPPSVQLLVLIAGAVVFDLGFQAVLISHQTIVYGIDPAARSRLNAILFTGMFIGMAAGSAAGALLYARGGWLAVTLLATVTSLAALLLRLQARVAPALAAEGR